MDDDLEEKVLNRNDTLQELSKTNESQIKPKSQKENKGFISTQ